MRANSRGFYRRAVQRTMATIAHGLDAALDLDVLAKQAAMIALYFDDPESTPASELRAEAALSVPVDKVLAPKVGENLLPAGQYACAMHEGGYDRIGDTWARCMGQRLPPSGRHLADSPSFERYLNTPMDVPMDQLRTELYIPLV